MDPGAWAAYGQHYQRLGAGGVNPSASSLTQSGQLNDLSLTASLPRQDSIGGYGSTAPPLLLSHHGLNVGQGGHHGEAAAASFVNVNSASLLPSGYDPMISATFQTTAKGHLSALNVSHSANLYKAMAGVKESEIGDLRGGFVRRGMPPTSMAPDPNMSMATSSGLFNPQTPPPHSWRHSNIVSNPASSPFGVLPHEAVLPRSGVGESMEKLHSQDHRSKSSRMMMDTSRYSMEQELASAAAAAAAAHGYRNVLSAQSRSAAMMDPNSGSRGSLMMQQPDSLGPGGEGIGLTGLKPSDYALYSNSNVNATRGLIPQNYITQSHFSPHQDLQGEKRDLYDIALLAEKVDGYGGNNTPKSHLDLFGSNSPSVSSSGNSASLHGMSPSPSQRASHRSSSSSSQSHGAHSRQMCSSQSHPRVTTHSATYTTYSSTSTAASYSQSYHPSPQPSPSQPMHSPAHYSSTTAVDFSNTVPAHSAHTPVSSSQYPQTSSVLVHSDSPGVVYSSVITRATVPPSSTGTYTSPMLSQKSLSSKQHLNHNEPKLPTPTPPPQQSQSTVQRSYEPVIHTPDISNDNCMGDILPANNNIPSSIQRVVSTPTGSTGGGSAGSASNLTIDHSLIRSPSITSGPAVGGRGSADSACTSPKSIAMETVFNSQQMTLQDLADMSSSNDKMDLESSTVVLLPPKESLVDDEPHLMDLSQPAVASQHAIPTGVLEHMGNNHLKEEKVKKKRPRKKKKQLQEEAAALQAALNSTNGSSAPSQLPMMPMGMPPCSHAGQMTQSMCPPEPPVNQLYPSSSCSSRPCMSSPLISTGPNYSMTSNAHQMFPTEGQQSVPVESCLENAPAFSQNGTLSVTEGIEPDILSQGIPPSSPPLASLFDPLPTSPQGNAEAAAFEAKLRNEASQIAKQLDKRGPSIEDDLGFLAELPPICNIACEKRKPELLKASASSSSNFIDSFLRFLENTELGPGQTDGNSNTSSHRHGGRGRGKSRETFTTPPQGKNVELNPVTGLFVCTEKNRGLSRSHGLNSARFQNSLHRRNKSGKFDINVTAQGKDDAIPAPSALTFSSDEEEGMANQGFVDSVKIALQSLSDNEGYEANQEAASWTEPNFNDNSNQNANQDTHTNWASPKPAPGNGDSSMYGLIKENSDARMEKIGRNTTEKWPKKEVSQNSEPKQAVSEPNDISDCSDKEFFDLALPRRETSVRKCKERTLQKKKEKVSKRKRHDHESCSDEKINSSGSETDAKPGQLYDPEDRIWPSVAKDGLEAKFPCSGSEEETVQKHSSGLRGRRKGYATVSPNSGLLRGRPSGKQIWSPDAEPSDDLNTHGTKIKKSRGRGKSKASKYSDSKDELKHVIREGGFRTGDFIILLSDKNHVDAPLWRIEGHGVLQKFEPFKEGEKIFYKGKPNGSGIKMGAKSFYEPATVLFVRGDKTNPIVEYLKDYQRKGSTLHQISKNHEDDESLAQKENFEVYLQTLISQVLDPNFISEIVKENDEYFLSHVHEIDGIVIKKKNLLAKKIPWNTAMRDCAEHFPTISVRPFTAEGGGKLMCQACAKERVSLRNITFEGQLYDYITLSHLTEMPLGKKLDEREFSLCTDCTDMVQAYTQMHHQKYNLFIMCVNKVNSIRSLDPTQESHVILEQCLQDSLWINKLFCKIRNVWRACAVMCR